MQCRVGSASNPRCRWGVDPSNPSRPRMTMIKRGGIKRRRHPPQCSAHPCPLGAHLWQQVDHQATTKKSVIRGNRFTCLLVTGFLFRGSLSPTLVFFVVVVSKYIYTYTDIYKYITSMFSFFCVIRKRITPSTIIVHQDTPTTFSLGLYILGRPHPHWSFHILCTFLDSIIVFISFAF